MTKGLYRDIQHKKIAGVCAGLAEYFDVDVTIVRIAFVLGVVLHAIGILAYVILWIAMSEKPGSAWAAYQSGVQGGPVYAAQYDSAQNSQASNPSRSRKSALIAGISLIGIGVYFLLANLLPWFDAETYAPIFLVLAGVLILVYGFIGNGAASDQQWATSAGSHSWTNVPGNSTNATGSFSGSHVSNDSAQSYSTSSGSSPSDVESDVESDETGNQHGGLS